MEIRKIETLDELYMFSKENPKGDPILNLKDKLNEVVAALNALKVDGDNL